MALNGSQYKTGLFSDVFVHIEYDSGASIYS